MKKTVTISLFLFSSLLLYPRQYKGPELAAGEEWLHEKFEELYNASSDATKDSLNKMIHIHLNILLIHSGVLVKYILLIKNSG
jgi:hypothetical protein